MRQFVLWTVYTLAFVAASIAGLRAYATIGHTWGTTQVPYYVNPQNVYVSQAAATTALQTAASAWSAQTQANIQLVYAGATNGTTVQYNQKNEVFFRNDSGVAETYYWSDLTSGRLVDSDIVFHEASFPWFTGTSGCSGGLYIEDGATHEFGHMLGMAHSGLTTATMYANTSYCNMEQRTLDADDIAGIQFLYPPSKSTSPTPPVAPSQLSVIINVSNLTGSLVQSWVDNATNEDGYRVERSSDGVTFSQIAQLGASAIGYVDSGLAAGATYYYRVAAFNSSGMSGYSNLASGSTQALAQLTSAPSSPTSPSPTDGATSVSTSVTLSWSCSGAQSYDVYINSAVYHVTNPSVQVSSLAASASYSWYVVANNIVGSTTGPAWSFTTKAPSGKRRRK